MSEISQPFGEVENARPEDYFIYSRRENFTVFEVSCLIMGKDPERVLINARIRSAQQNLAEMARAAFLGNTETAYLGGEHEEIIRKMMIICNKTRIWDSVTVEQAREMTGLLRRKWPKELLQETIMERSRRRLKRLRQLGGEYEEHGEGRYIVTLHDGALTALAEEEKTMLRPAYDKKSVCEDLKRAREEEKEASKNRHQAS